MPGRFIACSSAVDNSVFIVSPTCQNGFKVLGYTGNANVHVFNYSACVLNLHVHVFLDIFYNYC